VKAAAAALPILLLTALAVNGLTKSALAAIRAAMALEELLLEVRGLGWEKTLSSRRRS